MNFKKILPLIIALFAMPVLIQAQVTTSSISGVVKNKSGNALPGATITAVHEPTGTVILRLPVQVAGLILTT